MKKIMNQYENLKGMSIYTGISKRWYQSLLNEGIKEEVLLHKSGIDPKDLENPDGRLPIELHIRLVQAGIDLLNDPSFPISLASKSTA
jgi:hypothetical protein